VRYGVQPALTRLPDQPHVLARQALVRRLRVVVPILIVPTVLPAVRHQVLVRKTDVTLLAYSVTRVSRAG
jgi:hypothetical protein